MFPCAVATTALVVEDNFAQQYILAKQLKDAGYTVAIAGTAARALEAAKELPDVIILDVNLPDGSGFDICRRLKQNGTTRNIPIVFLTASHQTASDRDDAFEAGADAFLFAPVHPDSLLAVLLACVQRRRSLT